jgi:para-nitrobenzyl esterase
LAITLCTLFLLPTVFAQETAKPSDNGPTARTVSAPAGHDGLLITTAAGKIRGKEIGAAQVHAFLGVPYAAAPVGALRWVAPQPVTPWKGVLDATAYGHRCAQIHDDWAIFHGYQDAGESEDCLYLNVYAPATAHPGDKLPVMLWIHGGAWAFGAGSEARQNGEYLPTKGVILVTINYRLGVFGFLALKGLADEANGHTGNYGYMDMVQSLAWVHDNIAGFGGDAGNVTVFGESAGGAATCILAASPMARGLFQKGIGESGPALGTLPTQETLPAAELKYSTWTNKAFGTEDPAALRALPTKTLLENVAGYDPVGLHPIIDGQFLTESVAETYAAGRQAPIALIVGWNKDEGFLDGEFPRSPSLFHGKVTAEQFRFKAEEWFPNPVQAAEFQKLYPAGTDNEANRSAIDYDGDLLIGYGSTLWLRAQRRMGQTPVYRYQFDITAPVSKYHAATASHTDEIEYVFGTLDTRLDTTWRDQDRKLSEQMMGYWTNFAKTGNPNGPGLPGWPAYGADDSTIHFDTTITAGPDRARGRYEFLEKNMPPLHY